MNKRQLTHRDMAGDNRLVELLEERHIVKTALDDAQARLKEINDEIKTKVGEDTIATLPGWSIKYTTWHRGGYTVNEQDIKQLNVTRMAED